MEYISDKKIVGAKTLFATHYHELTQLEGQLSGVKNYCVAIKESGDDVIFLHKINPGSGDQSYGIEVAKLAGLPHWVLEMGGILNPEFIDWFTKYANTCFLAFGDRIIFFPSFFL